MYIQLAESPEMLADSPALSGTGIDDNYIFVPAGFMENPEDMFVRDDFFDDLPDDQWENLMDELEPYQMPMGDDWDGQSLSFLGFGKKARQRRQQKREQRHQRHQARQAKKAAKTQIKLAKAGAIKAGTYKSPLTGILDTVGGIFGGKGAEMPTKGLSVEYSDVDQGQPQKKGFPTWGYLALAGGTGLVIFALTHKKDKKKK